MIPIVGCLAWCSVVPTSKWEDAQQHGVGLVPGLVAMLPHAPLIAEGTGITIAGEVHSSRCAHNHRRQRADMLYCCIEGVTAIRGAAAVVAQQS